MKKILFILALLSSLICFEVSAQSGGEEDPWDGGCPICGFACTGDCFDPIEGDPCISAYCDDCCDSGCRSCDPCMFASCSYCCDSGCSICDPCSYASCTDCCDQGCDICNPIEPCVGDDCCGTCDCFGSCQGDDGNNDPDPDPDDNNQSSNDDTERPLNNEERESLNNTINRINRKCFGAQVLNGITVPTININSTQNVAGGYNAQTGTITFNNASSLDTEGSVLHELGHYVQDSFYGNNYMENAGIGDKIGYSNIEFEMAILIDIYSEGSNTAMGGGMKYEYLDFIAEIKLNGFTSNFEDQFNYFLPFFKDANPKYNTPSDPNFSPTFIQSFNPNCN